MCNSRPWFWKPNQTLFPKRLTTPPHPVKSWNKMKILAERSGCSGWSWMGERHKAILRVKIPDPPAFTPPAMLSLMWTFTSLRGKISRPGFQDFWEKRQQVVGWGQIPLSVSENGLNFLVEGLPLVDACTVCIVHCTQCVCESVCPAGESFETPFTTLPIRLRYWGCSALPRFPENPFDPHPTTNSASPREKGTLEV